MKHFLFGVVVLSASASALAQPVAGASRPDPRDASAAVAPVVHQSPFAQYRPFAAEVLGPWRGVNDEVGRIGGWKVYAREAYEANRQPASANPGTGDPAGAPPSPDAAKAK